MLLRVEYGADRVGLSVYLAGMLFDATGDLLRHTRGPAARAGGTVRPLPGLGRSTTPSPAPGRGVAARW